MNRSEAGKLGNIKSQLTQQKQKEERIAAYNANPNRCLQCENPLDYKHKHNKFCSQSCSATYNNQKRYGRTYNQKPITYKKVKLSDTENKLVRDYGNCVYCGKPLTAHKRKFCNNKCEADYKHQQAVLKWKNGENQGIATNGNVSKTIRRYLLDKYNHKCAQCGWHEINPFTGKVPLEVHHINGDWTDNREENLIILCPNCHSLTGSYKASNFGKGRPQRLSKTAKINSSKILEKVEDDFPKEPKKIKEKIKYFCKECGKEISSSGSDLCVQCSHIKSRKTERPSKEELFEMIKTMPFVQIGKKYGVSDNAVRKWCKSYGLPYRTMDIKQLKNGGIAEMD